MSFQDILFDSRDRASGTNTKFKIPLPYRLEHVRAVELLSVMLPYSVPNIYSGNNVFRWTYSGTAASLTIPAGCYTATSLCSYIQTGMNAHADPNTYTLQTLKRHKTK